MITSHFDNFPSMSVWITSSVSIVYEQPSYHAFYVQRPRHSGIFSIIRKKIYNKVEHD